MSIIFSKSKSFLILLVLTMLLTIAIISAIVIDNNVTVNKIQDCTTEFYDATEDIFDYVTRERNVYGNCTYYRNYTHCLNTSGANTDCSTQQLTYNFSCIIGTESYQSYEKVSEKVVQKNKTTCNKKGYTINIAGSKKKIDFTKCGVMCNRDGTIIQCDMCPDENGVSDGNCDGILQSGESGFKFNLKNINWHKIKIKADSSKFRKLKACIVENE